MGKCSDLAWLGLDLIALPAVTALSIITREDKASALMSDVEERIKTLTEDEVTTADDKVVDEPVSET